MPNPIRNFLAGRFLSVQPDGMNDELWARRRIMLDKREREAREQGQLEAAGRQGMTDVYATIHSPRPVSRPLPNFTLPDSPESAHTAAQSPVSSNHSRQSSQHGSAVSEDMWQAAQSVAQVEPREPLILATMPTQSAEPALTPRQQEKAPEQPQQEGKLLSHGRRAQPASRLSSFAGPPPPHGHVYSMSAVPESSPTEEVEDQPVSYRRPSQASVVPRRATHDYAPSDEDEYTTQTPLDLPASTTKVTDFGAKAAAQAAIESPGKEIRPGVFRMRDVRSMPAWRLERLDGHSSPQGWPGNEKPPEM